MILLNNLKQLQLWQDLEDAQEDLSVVENHVQDVLDALGLVAVVSDFNVMYISHLYTSTQRKR